MHQGQSCAKWLFGRQTLNSYVSKLLEHQTVLEKDVLSLWLKLIETSYSFPGTFILCKVALRADQGERLTSQLFQGMFCMWQNEQFQSGLKSLKNVRTLRNVFQQIKGKILSDREGKQVFWANGLVVLILSNKTTKTLKLVLRIGILYDKTNNISPLSVLENEIVDICPSSGQIEILTFCFDFRI